ncbi:unnamed protein product [Gongylonema pulchrum]|uniref:Uncharacterized protein n=1 Tax=Gongylonema pulchrum TaxID=637853 RepID=A0A3P6SPQ3_9BILA|nr:unnamed protein product [Gongylonema pulchrum]
MAQIYYTPLNTDVLRKYMDESTPNLVAFLGRMRETYWKDWDEACRTLSLDTQNTALSNAETNK